MRKIGIRFHTARVLTGLKRDDFAQKHNLSTLSVKNWEAGVLLPRHEGIVAAITALKDSGVFVSSEWLLYGNGNGPNYYHAHNFECDRSKDAFINEQIATFKKSHRAQGFEPIVVAVKDDSMTPTIRKGDILGGILVTHELVKSALAHHLIQKRAWLVGGDSGSFVPAFVDFRANTWFMNNAQDTELREIEAPRFARIKWHYTVDE